MLAPELETLPVRFPVTLPVAVASMDVALIVPFTSNFVVGVAVPIPTLDSLPSIVITAVVDPPSLTLNVMSVSATAFEIIAPLESTVNDKSLSVPNIIPPSLATVIVPDVVSFAFDLR